MAADFRLTAATGLHRGDRAYQQDQVAILQHSRNPQCLLGIVADGMGGRSGGREAAGQVLLTARQLLDGFDPGTDVPGAFLQIVVAQAHLIIRLSAMASGHEPHTTVAAFLLTPDARSHWSHCGDSRIYLFQRGRLIHRTRDHSYVQALLQSNTITEAQAHNHPRSNLLLGSLGSESDPPVALHSTAALQVGDALLACSDGLWSHFSATELGRIIDALSPSQAATQLISKARERGAGNGDNMALAIVKFEPLPAASG